MRGRFSPRYTFPFSYRLCEHRESRMWVISSCETNVPRTVIRGMHLTERHLIRPPIGSTVCIA